MSNFAPKMASGIYIATAADNTANAFTIQTFLSASELLVSSISIVALRSAALVELTGAVFTFNPGTGDGNILIIDAGAFAVATGDEIHYQIIVPYRDAS